MRITHNLPALKIANKLNVNQNNSAKLMEKLSSGKQVNRAADDAAGLAISEKMLAQIRGLNQGSRNSNDGISLVLTAQGGLTEINNQLQRIRELCIEAATDTMTDNDRQKVQLEINQLLDGIDQTAKITKFNTIPLLAAEDIATSTNLGLNGGSPVSLNVINNGLFHFTTATGQNLNYPLDGSRTYLYAQIDGVTYRLQDHCTGTTTGTSPAGTPQATSTYVIGGITITQTIRITGPDNNMYRIGFGINNTSRTDATVSLSFNVDTCLDDDDRAPFTVNDTSGRTCQQYTSSNMPEMFYVHNSDDDSIQASAVILGEYDSEDAGDIPPTILNIGRYGDMCLPTWDWSPSGSFTDSAYGLQWNSISLGAGNSVSMHTYYGSTVPGENPINTEDELPEFTTGLNIHTGANTDQNILLTRHDVTTPNLGINRLRVSSASVASASIGKVDNALNIIAGELGRYGSYQNRLEYAATNADITAENTQAAQSRIIDTNVAKKFSEFGKFQILEQASTAMLAQANQFPQKVLELLR